MTRVVLVQCTKSKRDGEHAARDLYDQSDYYCKQRAYAEAVADVWFIQSAKYGLVRPDEVVESYNAHASNLDDPDGWAAEIAADLVDAVGTDVTVELLGGMAYTDPLTPELERRGIEVLEPLRGKGIGQRKSALLDMSNRSLEGYA